MRRPRKRLLFAMAWGVLVLFGCASTEFAARLWLVAHAQLQAFPSDTARREWGALPSHWTLDDYLVYDDFEGDFYQIRDGARVTSGTPSHWTNSIYLFGNSSTFDLFVSTEQTAASQLQALLNADGYGYRVVNYGTSGAPVSAEFARLRDTPLRRGDIVVFIDGILPEFAKPNCNLAGSRYATLAVAELACNALNALPARDLSEPVSRYWRGVAAVQVYTEAHRATFVHIVQPVRLSLYAAYMPLRLVVPAENYADDEHLTGAGDALLAHAIAERLIGASVLVGAEACPTHALGGRFSWMEWPYAV